MLESGSRQFHLQISSPDKGMKFRAGAFAALSLISMAVVCFYVRTSLQGRTVDYATSDDYGTSFIDEALLTHESNSHSKSSGDNQNSDKFDPITSALADVEVKHKVIQRISSKMTKQMQEKLLAAEKEESWRIANEKSREDHPWDDMPEGMPTHDGRMISAADLASGNLSPEQTADSYALRSVQSAQKFIIENAQKHRRAGRSTAGDAVDPTAVADLDGALVNHEGDRDDAEYRHVRESPPQARRVPQTASRSNEGRTGPTSKQQQHQGFVYGSHLRVTPKEFHHEMKRFLPSSDGRLISPFEWFQTGGAGYS